MIQPAISRLFDLVASAIGILLLSPLLLAVAVAVRVTSAGPAFHRAKRVGKDGHLFELYKFRSMRVGGAGGAAITRAGDPRVTPIGRIIRRAKLDELPQLFNVVKGDMSLVGPRPEDPRYVAMYDAEQRRILSVRPGITSAASLQYRDEESHLTGDDWERTYIEKIMPEKLRIDLDYLAKKSLLTDLRLIFATVGTMFGRR